MFRKSVICGGLLLFATAGASAQQTDCSASAAQFAQIQNGMSYPQVMALIGCEGELLSSSEMADFKTEMYAWSGSGGFGANMNAMFQNGKLVSKAQFGLK